MFFSAPASSAMQSTDGEVLITRDAVREQLRTFGYNDVPEPVLDEFLVELQRQVAISHSTSTYSSSPLPSSQATSSASGTGTMLRSPLVTTSASPMSATVNASPASGTYPSISSSIRSSLEGLPSRGYETGPGLAGATASSTWRDSSTSLEGEKMHAGWTKYNSIPSNSTRETFEGWNSSLGMRPTMSDRGSASTLSETQSRVGMAQRQAQSFVPSPSRIPVYRSVSNQDANLSEEDSESDIENRDANTFGYPTAVRYESMDRDRKRTDVLGPERHRGFSPVDGTNVRRPQRRYANQSPSSADSDSEENANTHIISRDQLGGRRRKELADVASSSAYLRQGPLRSNRSPLPSESSSHSYRKTLEGSIQALREKISSIPDKSKDAKGIAPSKINRFPTSEKAQTGQPERSVASAARRVMINKSSGKIPASATRSSPPGSRPPSARPASASSPISVSAGVGGASSSFIQSRPMSSQSRSRSSSARPKKHDPVKAYQRIRDIWKRDRFLSADANGHKDLRWAVRCHMLSAAEDISISPISSPLTARSQK